MVTLFVTESASRHHDSMSDSECLPVPEPLLAPLEERGGTASETDSDAGGTASGIEFDAGGTASGTDFDAGSTASGIESEWDGTASAQLLPFLSQ